MKIQAIIPAAGAGRRLKTSVPKPFIEINDKPMIVHTLSIFERCQQVSSVVLVVPQDQMAEFEKLISAHKLHKVIRIVAGGDTRRKSVYNGLQVIDHDTDIVLVHDGARPLADAGLIDRVLSSSLNENAVVIGVPLKPTVKRIDPEAMLVKETIARHNLWEIQTPQIFKKDILIKAHEQNGSSEATDDAMLVEKLGIKVRIVEGSYDNIKVTTPEDVALAEFFMNRKKE